MISLGLSRKPLDLIHHMKPTLKEHGFTLLELAMVLFIITLILGAVLTPLSTRMEAEERKKTTEQLKEIKDNLIGYALVNGYLPCPDCPDGAVGNCGAIEAGNPNNIDDGQEDGVDNVGDPADRPNYSSCATEEGNLPWATLGVDQFDAWTNRFVYRVTESFADDQDGTGCGTPSAGISFEMCSTGNIDIDDDAGNSVASDVPAIVISYGKNADDPTNPSSASEIENQGGTAGLFIQKDYTTGSGTDEFDDLLIWIPTSTLIYRMVQAERLP